LLEADVAADPRAQLLVILDAQTVHDVALKEWKNDSMWALSEGVPLRLMLCWMPRILSRFLSSEAEYSLPRSLWKIKPGLGTA